MEFGSRGNGDDGITGVSPSCFSYDVTKWKLNKNKNAVGLPLVNALAMRVGTFPLFLEGPVRHLKTMQDDPEAMKDARYTDKQGQYLAFIYYFTKLNGIPPAEADMQRYFQVSPPSIHQMIMNLERKGLISKIPGQGRSIKVLLPRWELPDLD